MHARCNRTSNTMLAHSIFIRPHRTLTAHSQFAHIHSHTGPSVAEIKEHNVGCQVTQMSCIKSASFVEIETKSRRKKKIVCRHGVAVNVLNTQLQVSCAECRVRAVHLSDFEISSVGPSVIGDFRKWRRTSNEKRIAGAVIGALM